MSSQESVPSFLLFLELSQDTFQRKHQNRTSDAGEGWEIDPLHLFLLGFFFFACFSFPI